MPSVMSAYRKEFFHSDRIELDVIDEGTHSWRLSLVTIRKFLLTESADFKYQQGNYLLNKPGDNLSMIHAAVLDSFHFWAPEKINSMKDTNGGTARKK